MIDLIIELLTPNTLIEVSFLFLAFSLALALPSIVVNRRDLERYCGLSEWRVGKIFKP